MPLAQVPIVAKADSMTVEELHEFRADVREKLGNVRSCPLSIGDARHQPPAVQCVGHSVHAI